MESRIDYKKAIENLKEIMINEEKFADINKSIFDAIDTDNSGTLEKEEVQTFVTGLLRGIHQGKPIEDLESRHRVIF